METLETASLVRWEAGRSSDGRSSPRRRTLARVRVIEGPALGEGILATDLSADGAFLRNARSQGLGERVRLSLRLRLEIPTDPQPVDVSARIVRVTPGGVGVRFEEVSARDRARPRAYAGFYEMDEAIVRVQRALGDVIPGNLLPLGERSEVEAILRSAMERALPMTAVLPGRGFKPRTCRLLAVEPGAPDEGAADLLRLDLMLLSERVVYLAFSDPPLHYAFEAIVAEPGESPLLLLPERVYLTERRTALGHETRVHGALAHDVGGVEAQHRHLLPVPSEVVHDRPRQEAEHLLALEDGRGDHDRHIGPGVRVRRVEVGVHDPGDRLAQAVARPDAILHHLDAVRAPWDRRVLLRAWVEEGDGLAIRIADTGPGIPDELAGHLFEPFATTGKKQGTGLGLVTVRNLVRAHGGEIRVETAAPEGGAAFTVTLPLTPVESEKRVAKQGQVA